MMLSKVVSIIETLTSSAIGPSPKFDEYHVIKLLMTLLKEGSIGRTRLSKILMLGEGSTRTLISRMKSMGLIEESRKGCSLTPSGREVADVIASKISCITRVPIESFGISGVGVGVLVKGAPARVDVIKLRDEAVRRGAKALITMLLVKGKLAIPTVEDDVMARWPDVSKYIFDAIKPQEGDAILIGIADQYSMAERGALMAAWSLALEQSKSVNASSTS
ncbi:MAG: DUF4443 domain-containing protein [Candidatus Nezhaarchaeales archaeon]